ncbi:L-threonylcarbamoyladenylate synthase [Gryllotalpicola reticulitermitis]|uniref:L-threonylcarbamoyladenylate synthase n=1 Tax=Gryllotalpicola reticulitermitis TaxID=1184153 RepID=A0ABV8Q8R8_9MICO
MVTVYDCDDPEQRDEGMRLAREALERGDVVVIPTDTVYGVAVDAFNPAAVQRLQDAKGRGGRKTPPAVLVPDAVTINRLAMRVPGAVHQLTPRFWPGGLTIVLQAQSTLEWDLGDTEGTVAIRMPRNDVALELLREVGPLAVSTASVAGLPPATTGAEAAAIFGDAVAVVLDGGAGGGAEVADEAGADPDAGVDGDAGAAAGSGDTAVAGASVSDAGVAQKSTILDATVAVESGKYRVLRRGVVTVEQLRIALGETAVIDVDPSDGGTPPAVAELTEPAELAEPTAPTEPDAAEASAPAAPVTSPEA